MRTNNSFIRLLALSVVFFFLFNTLLVSASSPAGHFRGKVLGTSVGDEFAYYKWNCKDGAELVGANNCMSLDSLVTAAVSSCGECVNGECNLSSLYVKFLCSDGVSPCDSIDNEGNCEDVVPTITSTPTLTNTPTITFTPSPTPTEIPSATPTPLPSVNLISNFGFEIEKTNWSWTKRGGTGSFSVVPPGVSSANSAVVKLTKSGSNVQLFQFNIPLKQSTQYRLSFDGKASKNISLPIYLIKHTSPYTNYGLTYTANLTTSWNNFSITFSSTIPNATVDDARLRFNFSNKTGTFYLDNISLTEL